MSPEKFVFGWWNANLSPPRTKARPCETKVAAARQIIGHLADSGVDFIGICEVNDEDIELIYGVFSELGYNYRCIKGTRKIRRSKFDLGVYYNEDKIALLDMQFITHTWVNSTLKTALRVDILPKIGNVSLSVFLCHWPSVRTQSQKRRQFGSSLREHINRGLAADIRYVITMGDFNFEPFDKVLSEDLYATRDRIKAKQSTRFLYNPFWRHLGEKTMFEGSTPLPGGSCGTYFYPSGLITRWHTYDQIMFSSSFLSPEGFYLDERYSIILNQNKGWFDFFRERDFDHFPVISAIAINPNEKIKL